jgi:prepilin-type processing-associated H-X9-DG protein
MRGANPRYCAEAAMNDDRAKNKQADADPMPGIDQRTDEEWAAILKPPPRRWSFSLRTMFFIVTCVAVFFAGVRVAGPKGVSLAFGLFFLFGFLTIWSTLRRRFRIRTSALLLLTILTGACSLLPMVALRAKASARQLVCEGKLFEIEFALKNYQQKYGSFPPVYLVDAKGNALYSWRALILPEMHAAWRPTLNANEAWNGPTNSLVASTATYEFHCPDDDQPFQMTSYLAIIGPNAAWTATGPRKLADFKNPAKTILVIEMEGSGVNWLEPRDLFAGQFKDGFVALAGASGTAPHPEGFNALFADGHVESLPANIDPAELMKMIDIDQRDEMTDKK